MLGGRFLSELGWVRREDRPGGEWPQSVVGRIGLLPFRKVLTTRNFDHPRPFEVESVDPGPDAERPGLRPHVPERWRPSFFDQELGSSRWVCAFLAAGFSTSSEVSTSKLDRSQQPALLSTRGKWYTRPPDG